MNTVNRIVFNTLSQYLRIVLGAVLMLYATRIVLKELGDVDFGLYSLLGSVVVFLSFVAITLSRSTQRFLSYYLGLKDMDVLRKVFFNSVVIHFIASIIIALIIFSVEGLMFKYIFDIGPGKIDQAKILYKLLIVGVFVTMNTSPFMAIFISHENIVFTSFIHIGAYVLRLIGAFSLTLFDSPFKLIAYAVIMVVVPFAEMLCYFFVARYKYSECREFIRIDSIDKRIILELLSFSGWNMYGTVCILSRTQGYAMVVNHFFGLLYNAGYGIATQISTQINSLVYALSNAVSPIITKSEGGKDRNKMIYGSIESSKISFILFIVLAIPFLFFGMPLLKIWLGEVPPGAFLFSCIIVLTAMADSFSSGLRTGIYAIGSIKWFTIKVYSIKVFTIVFSIIVFKMHGSLFMSLLPFLIFEILGSIMTINIFCKLTSISKAEVARIILLKSSLPLVISIATCCVIEFIMGNESIFATIIAYAATFIAVCVTSYIFSLDTKEKQAISFLFKKIKR